MGDSFLLGYRRAAIRHSLPGPQKADDGPGQTPKGWNLPHSSCSCRHRERQRFRRWPSLAWSWALGRLGPGSEREAQSGAARGVEGGAGCVSERSRDPDTSSSSAVERR